MRVRVSPAPCRGQVTVPPSKSLSHRYLLCAALAQGESRVENLAFSQDILATLDGMEALGAQVERGGDFARLMGCDPLAPGGDLAVDCRESGSTLRFLIPLLALSGRQVRLTGSPRLLERPQGAYEELFSSRGLLFDHRPDAITLGGPLKAGRFFLHGDVSSQFVTGLLLALPQLPGDSILAIAPPVESRSYIGLTLQAMEEFGVRAVFADENTLVIPGHQRFLPGVHRVEGDFSQLAFFAVLGAIGGQARCLGVPQASRQGDRVILDILSRCGAAVSWSGESWEVGAAPLAATTIDLADCPDLGPVLTVLGACCQGRTVIQHAGRLRYKESDRIAAMEQELGKLGVAIASSQDSITIDGGALRVPDAPLQSHNDHRIAMSLAVAASRCPGPVVIEGAQAVNKSYPGFWEELRAMGVPVEILEP